MESQLVYTPPEKIPLDIEYSLYLNFEAQSHALQPLADSFLPDAHILILVETFSV